jgi:hypothetical protein
MKFSWVKLRLLFALGLGAGVMVAPGQTPPAAAPATTAPAANAAPAGAATPAPAADVIPEMHVGDKVYYDVHVISVNPLTVVFSHRDGVGSAELADLSPDLQQRFGYDPAKAAAELARRQGETQAQRVQAGLEPGDKLPPSVATQQILQRFGQPPKIFAEVSLRPRFDALGINAKNQGAQPSCSVFAIVSALEYQMSSPEGPAPQFSEEYLIWATLQTLGRNNLSLPKQDTPGYDIGFALTEVVQALRAYGIAFEAEVPYRLTTGDAPSVDISTEVINRAKQRNMATGFYVTGRSPEAEIANIVQVLNSGVPVIVGLNWPDEQVIESTNIFDAQPGREKYSHAVLLVGYHATGPNIEDAVFLFKNSYGVQWGDQGYGAVSYRYLQKNLQLALFLDIK